MVGIYIIEYLLKCKISTNTYILKNYILLKTDIIKYVYFYKQYKLQK